ncbi:MAG TPA: peptidoglycan-binding domain-containing protein [Terriglobia bacterium]|nr:peptidoglycan-binding domain-containing protein [Terriglobia bacterium]
MPTLSYRQPGLVLAVGTNDATEQQVHDLQGDLRALGYLKRHIDGKFGSGTEQAVKALQRDLLINNGTSTGGDGPAPVRVIDYNQGRVNDVTGQADQGLVECISAMLDDANFVKLPSVPDPGTQNAQAVSQIASLPAQTVPMPFLLAIFEQESNLMHFCVPASADADTFIVTGLDTNDRQNPERITSRGYGIGQYTLFHHPPTAEEVAGIMLDPSKNVLKAIGELREKFDRFVNGPASEADDRQAEFGNGPLRLCKYSSDDARYMKDCRQCALDAGTVNIQAGSTPLYPGSRETYQPTPNYPTASYQNVPVRQAIGCDWPYAARRYNGAGMDSYHYQVRILRNLLLTFGAEAQARAAATGTGS